MYIPAWLIIGAIIVVVWYFAKSKKQYPAENNMPQIFEQIFSYKLNVEIEPNWYNLYKKLCNPKSEKDFEKIVEAKIKEIEKDNGSTNLWGRRYYFTEYYDLVSGLTTRFQRVLTQNGKQYFYPVDEFGDRGYVFEADREAEKKFLVAKFINGIDVRKDDEKRGARQKSSIKIEEASIRKDVFDENGDPKLDKENYLFQFPLYDIFNFLFALSRYFHDECRIWKVTIIKWPDQIEKKFQELGIEHINFFDYEPKPFDLEKYYKEFFEKWGKPKISFDSGKDIHGGYLFIKDKTYYSVSLKMFRHGENDRIS